MKAINPVSDDDICFSLDSDRVKAALSAILVAMTLLSGSELRAACKTGESPSSECVILLHGLGRSAGSMGDMAAALQAAGYMAVNLDYPSREYSIERLAEDTIAMGLERCRSKGCHQIHFVTHSMGGILVRCYLTQHTIPELGRVVMLSPPNQGSEAVEVLKNISLYRWYFGPAGQQLGIGPGSFASRLGPVTQPVGIITGNKHTWFDAWLSKKIPGEDDGKVSVQRAKVEGMHDFLVLPHDHTFIMKRRDVIEQTIYFLRQGRFKGHMGMAPGMDTQ